MRDNISGCQYVNLGTLTIGGATKTTSGYLDTRGFDAASIVVVNGTITNAGTAAGFTVTLQESARHDRSGGGNCHRNCQRQYSHSHQRCC